MPRKKKVKSTKNPTKRKASENKESAVSPSRTKAATVPQVPVDDQIKQLVSYVGDLQDYLRNAKADIEGFRFRIEKGSSHGTFIDVIFKATIKSDMVRGRRA